MNRPYSHEEIAHLAAQVLQPLEGRSALLVHVVMIEGLMQTLKAFRAAEGELPTDLQQLEQIATVCGEKAYAALREGPYDGLTVA